MPTTTKELGTVPVFDFPLRARLTIEAHVPCFLSRDPQGSRHGRIRRHARNAAQFPREQPACPTILSRRIQCNVSRYCPIKCEAFLSRKRLLTLAEASMTSEC